MEGKDFSIAIDIGGTFTDSVIANKNGKIFKVAKTASIPASPSELQLTLQKVSSRVLLKL